MTTEDNEKDDTDSEEFIPFRDIFLNRAEELIKFTQMCRNAIQETTGMPRLTEVLARVNKKHEEKIEPAKQLAAVAQLEVDSGFAILHSINVVLLWGGLESATRDFLVFWLVKYPEARQIDEIAKLRIRIGEYESLGIEDRMRYVLGLLEREHGSALRPGIARFTQLLHFVGIIPELEDELQKSLLEMSAVRNVIVHRGSTADHRFVEQCPWASWKEGDKIEVSGEHIQKYFRAQLSFVEKVITAAKEVEYFRADDEDRSDGKERRK